MLKRLIELFVNRKLYPIIVQQNAIETSGLSFEITNEVEKWRVLSLDDESEFLNGLISNLEPEDTFYDIGSCIGIYSLHAALHCNHVYAFEPDPGFQARITNNIRINGHTNITVLPLAVSNQEGEFDLYTDGIGGRSPSLKNFGQKNRIKVRCVSLDQVIESGKLPPPDIIKMDIEGAELLALRGAQKLLGSSRKPRLLFLELHPEYLTEFGHSLEAVFAFLTNHQYQLVSQINRDAQLHCVFQSKTHLT